MSKEELKENIKNIVLEPQVENILMGMIDGAEELDEKLLTTISEILEMHAKMEEMKAIDAASDVLMYDEILEDMEIKDTTEQSEI